MAAFETPWTYSSSMSHRRQPSSFDGNNDEAYTTQTTAPFSPDQHVVSHRQPNSILIHQKSPLLVATPPQVTRVLAASHPFILPLNHFVGLLSWTTGDPWESLLLVAGFWFFTLYADAALRMASPIVLVAGLILGMYSRRYSPLSSTSWSGEKKKAQHKRTTSEAQRKSLDEIVDTLHTFTARCDVLLDPFLRLTEFLSTQSSATSATTRPALTALFVRIIACTPIWIVLGLPRVHVITAPRIILVIGTIGLTWHSRPARVTRTILWRSRGVRLATSLLTGLSFPSPRTSPTLASSQSSASLASLLKSKNKTKDRTTGPGIRFTFTLYENQRRWLGLGWTNSLLAYERQAWTDETLSPAPQPSSFALPVSDLAAAKWKWAAGSEWRVEGAEKETAKEKSARRIGGGGGGEGVGWTYYDSKWQDGRKLDGWGRYTRSRKWVRDAELVDVSAEDADDADETLSAIGRHMDDDAESSSMDQTPSAALRRKGWFSKSGANRNPSVDLKSDSASATGSNVSTGRSSGREREPEDDDHDVLRSQATKFGGREWDRSFGDGVAEGLG